MNRIRLKVFQNPLNYVLLFIVILSLPFVRVGCKSSGAGDAASGAREEACNDKDARTDPEPPRFYVDTTIVPPSGETIAVPAGGNLQTALNQAKPGDVITLEAGATYTGPFTLPKKSGDGYIIIRTSAPDGSLPPPGERVDPSYAAVMPKLEAASGSVITAARRAHHYRFIGVEIRPREGVFLYNLVSLGGNEASVEQLPHHLIFDRCYIHGDPEKGSRRGIALNSSSTAVIDSYLSDFKEAGAEAQAILGWNGPGPFKIVNNHLEGAGENVMFGGSDPAIHDLVPSDIEIWRNHFFKPLSWKLGDPSYQGTTWTVKNLFELKNARRVLIEGNLFEHNWVQAQSGFAILFTVRNQKGSAPWSVVEDVTFRNNIVRHTASGVNILGRDNNYPSCRTKRILIRNNLFDDVGALSWGGGGTLFQVVDGTSNITIDHNTAFQTNQIILADGQPNEGFKFQNNIAPHNAYGIIGTGAGIGNSTINAYFPDGVIGKNVMVVGNAAQYPPDNFFPALLGDVRFVDLAGGHCQLADSSPYKHAGTDGKDIGVDFDALSEAMGLTPPIACSQKRSAERRPQS